MFQTHIMDVSVPCPPYILPFGWLSAVEWETPDYTAGFMRVLGGSCQPINLSLSSTDEEMKGRDFHLMLLCGVKL
jgi:hypothetical protein